MYRDLKPVFWSINQRRALFEDELEIKYDVKDGTFVKFKVTSKNSGLILLL